MDEKDLRSPFFITDDGYINIRLKVTTEDKVEREKIVADLMGKVYKSKGFKLSEHTLVDQMYFHNQNPKTVLKSLKKSVIEDIINIFDTALAR